MTDEVWEGVRGLGWEVMPGDVGRSGWEVRDARRDLEVLWLVSRFRFVTPEAVAVRFGVSVQRARARVRRLEKVGLLGSWRGHVSQHKAVWITGKGGELLGQKRRRPPQPTQARDHEDAIVAVASALERQAAGRPELRVLTEREIRQHEHRMGDRPDPRKRYSVSVGLGTNAPKRWPDIVVQGPGRKTAIEIEFAPKHRARLEAIIDAYVSPAYTRVVFIVRQPRLAAILDELMYMRHLLRREIDVPDFQIDPWYDLDPATHARIVQAAPRHARAITDAA